MDSLGNILTHKDFSQPPEVQAIKKYVKDQYDTDVTVLVREKDYVVSVPGAALAGTLRMQVPEMQRRCALTKKILFRIV